MSAPSRHRGEKSDSQQVCKRLWIVCESIDITYTLFFGGFPLMHVACCLISLTFLRSFSFVSFVSSFFLLSSSRFTDFAFASASRSLSHFRRLSMFCYFWTLFWQTHKKTSKQSIAFQKNFLFSQLFIFTYIPLAAFRDWNKQARHVDKRRTATINNQQRRVLVFNNIDRNEISCMAVNKQSIIYTQVVEFNVFAM